MCKAAIYLTLFLTLATCAEGKVIRNTRVLTYDIKLEILDDSKEDWTKNYLNQKYGDSVAITYDSHGNIRMDYFGSGNMGFDYIFYNSEKKRNCAKWKNLDTLYCYDTRINEYPIDSTVRKEAPDGFILIYYSQNPNASDDIIQEYHFIRDSLTIDARVYADFNDFSFSDMMRESKCLPVKTILTVEGIRLTRNLLHVKHIAKPERSFFEPPAGVPVLDY